MTFEKIPGSRQLPIDLDDGRDFPWGPIVQVHRIGRYAVVEYRADYSGFTDLRDGPLAREHGQTRFHAYVDGKDTCVRFLSLESALVGAIAYDREGPNTCAGVLLRSDDRGGGRRVTAADAAYRAALGLPEGGPLPKILGQTAGGAPASRRRRAVRNRGKTSKPPRGAVER